MNKNKAYSLVQSALIAAIYAVATYICAALGIAYGSIQFRFSEALMILSVFSPGAVTGLTIGCLISNLASPMGIWDIVFGSVATLLSALTARKLREIKFKGLPILSLLMPAIFNSLIIGAELSLLVPSRETGITLYIINALEVFIGEFVICFAGGIPLFYAIKKSKIFE